MIKGTQQSPGILYSAKGILGCFHLVSAFSSQTPSLEGYLYTYSEQGSFLI